MKKVTGKEIKILAASGILLLSFGLWLVPSNVVELIAEHRHVLLGRYGVTWFSVLFLLTPVLWLVSYAILASIRLSNREIGFRLAAFFIALVAATITIDLMGRLIRKPRYVERQVQFRRHWPGERVSDIVRHRPANRLYKIRYEDLPPTARSYPNAPSGHPVVNITLKTDARGYRNPIALDRCDIVTVGDSFTEGSRVSDDQCWPILLGKELNCRVYNLGISGGRPDYYLNVFRAFGLRLKPKIAIFMLYEGNDFKGTRMTKGKGRAQDPWGERVTETLKASPVVLGFKKAFIKYLGPVNADGTVRDGSLISWMPVAVPSGAGAKYYGFKPSRLMRLDWTESEFQKSPNWMSVAGLLKSIQKICHEEGIRLILAYAPSKPHVIMPMAWDAISAPKLHAFASFKKRHLPAPGPLKQRLKDNLDSQESVLENFCKREGIGFVSPTRVLQEMAEQGHQVYYTYDQHWTAVGHAVVAEVLSNYLKPLALCEEG